MLANQSASQMMSFILESKGGSLIVVDGGTPDDAGHLLETLRAKGGHVRAWFITHPHSDHVGALTEILNNPESGITIDQLAAGKQTDTLAMKSMREELKAVERPHIP